MFQTRGIQRVSDVVRLVHTGSFAGPRDAGPLLRALSRVQSEGVPIRLVLVGRVMAPDRVLLDTTAVDVEHVGVVPHRESLALQRSADVLLLLTSNNRGVATGKLFEYLGAGRPILALADGNEAARIVRETHSGITVPPDHEEAIAAGLREAASGRIHFAPTALEQFMYPAPARELLRIIEAAITKPRCQTADREPN